MYYYIGTEATNPNENIMNTLTAEQTKTINALIRLGDSKELAIKTVLSKEVFDNDAVYRLAYES